MRSNAKETFYFQADANALGGFIDQPLQKIIPSQVSSSLAPVGGSASARQEGFVFEDILSYRLAYTRVAGRQIALNGPWSITATAVVEGLNILEVITADRIVAQVSVEYPANGGYPRVVLAGTTFDRLRIGGCDANLTLNSSLLCGAQAPVSLPDFLRVGQKQAKDLIALVDTPAYQSDYQWLSERYRWMAALQGVNAAPCVLSSVIDCVKGPIPGTTFGHAVEIPDVGRIFLGETIVCRSSIQVVSFHIELGCNASGHASGPSANVKGVPIPPL